MNWLFLFIATNEPKSYLCRLLSPENLPNVGLFFAGVAGIIVAICTLKVIERQTKATESSVEALIRSERPWLLLAKNTTVPVDPPNNDWKFNVFVKNVGRTPAKIIALRVECLVGKSRTELPDAQFFTSDGVFQPFTMPQSDGIEWSLKLPRPWSATEILPERQFLWLCGFVRYHDTLERQDPTPYETYFCLVYNPAKGIRRAAWERSGPREYNGAI
jgi:hypothetical protein